MALFHTFKLLLLAGDSIVIREDAREINVSFDPIFDYRVDSNLYIPLMNFRINDLVMNNYVSSSNGGAVFFSNSGWKNPYFSISNTSFSQCQSSGNGGSVYAFDTNYILLNSSAFYNSYSQNNGGSAYFQTGKFAQISNLSVSNSTSSSNGGSFYILNVNEAINFDQIIINQSMAQSDGGSLCVINAKNITINGMDTTNSRSSNGNGGVLFLSGVTNTISINEMRIENSSSKIGGGYNIVSSKHLNMNSSSFIKCESTTGKGGAISFDGDSTSKIVIDSINGKDCTSKTEGGFGSFTSGSSIDLFRSYFENCISNTIGGSIRFSSFSNTISVQDCQFISCRANTEGGAIYINSPSSTTLLSDLMFYNCSSGTYAGAIFLNQGYGRIQKVCGYLTSSSTQNGIFMYAYNMYGTFSVNMSSISKSDSINSQMVNYVDNTYSVHNQVNFSENNAYRYSSFYLGTNNHLEVLYSTVVCNQVRNNYISYLNGNGNSFNVNTMYCNFVNNSGGNSMIHIQAQSTIGPTFMNSVFQQNVFSYLFSFEYHSSYYVYFKNCFFNVYNSFKMGTGNYQNQNCVQTNSLTMTYNNQFYQTYYCHAENPLSAPCSTLNGEAVYIYPPTPTECHLETLNNEASLISLSRILYILVSEFIL